MTSPIIIQQGNAAQSIQGGIANFLQAFQQQQAQQAQQQQSAEQLEIQQQNAKTALMNAELGRDRLRAQQAEAEQARLARQAIGEQISNIIAPAAPAEGTATPVGPQSGSVSTPAGELPVTPASKPAAPDAGRQTATGAVASLTKQGFAGEAVDALSAISSAEEVAAGREAQGELGRLRTTALGRINDPVMRQTLETVYVAQDAGTPPSIITAMAADLIEQGRIDPNEIAKLRRDPRLQTVAALPDAQFIQASTQVLQSLSKFNLGLMGTGPAATTEDEFVERHLTRLTLPSTDTFGIPHPAQFRPTEGANFLRQLWQGIQRTKAGARGFNPPRGPLTNTGAGGFEGVTGQNAEALAQALSEMLSSPTPGGGTAGENISMSQMRTLIESQMTQNNIPVDSRVVTAVLLRAGQLNMRR